uniref:RAB42, member RAS onco family n=1 Tax=Chrysemys picta bellii TaxID=8478 RepID=A0A8C3FW05_CHRPI
MLRGQGENLLKTQPGFRIILLGDSTVGKSSLLRRYAEGSFIPLWDTAGQERFRCITRSFYRNAVGVLLVFDMTNRKSFEHIIEWYHEVASIQIMEKVIFLLIGHKSDLKSDCKVSTEEAEGLAASLGIGFIETSAKSNTNVDLAFEILTNTIYEALKNKEIDLQEGWDGVKGGNCGGDCKTLFIQGSPRVWVIQMIRLVS